MNVLITGGAGYIGSHTAKLMANSSHETTVLDNLSRGHEWAIKWSKYIKGDLGNSHDLTDILKNNQIEAVIHFAAYSQVGESVEKPELYFRNNVVSTINLLEAMLKAGVKYIVFSSSAAVYGNPTQALISEDHPRNPVSPYGDTKFMMEKALERFGDAHDIRWMALRYFNAAGADPDGDIGEAHEDESHLIPLILQTVTGQRDHIDIYGTDYETPDGTAIRDYIHVTDLADAHIKALDHLIKGGKSEALNLGTGKGHSVKDVIKTVETVTGKLVPSNETVRRAGDPAELVADASKATKILNWKPEHSDLKKIITTAWNWHKNNIGKT